MRAFLALTTWTALTLSVALAQPDPVRVYTNPALPSRDALERLNLKLAWSIRLKTEGQRDGLFSIQLLPHGTGQQMIVQTLRGDLVALDAENGDVLWRTPVGPPYWSAQPVAANRQALFTTRRDELFVLDRDSGKQLLYDVEKDTGRPVFGLRLEGAPSAGLAADDELLYVVMEKRVSGYFVPDFRTLMKLRAREDPSSVLGGSKLKPSPQIRREWTQVMVTETFLQRPLVTRLFVGVTATDGTFIILNKLNGTERFRWQTEKPVLGRVAQHRDLAYVGSEDYNLYAFDLTRTRLDWRFPATAPILRPVFATDRDVYVSPERTGLYCLNREEGTSRWLNRDAERFLATNYRYVWATDRFGNLLVLDHQRGTSLAKYDARDFTVPIANELTDRLYLAAHNGLIVCLHHRENTTPLSVTTPGLAPPPPEKKDGEPKKGPPMKKDPEPKKGPPVKKGPDKMGTLRIEDRGSRIEEGQWKGWTVVASPFILHPPSPALHPPSSILYR